MKSEFTLIVVATALAWASGTRSALAQASSDVVVVDRGQNHRVWERTVTETLPDGRTVERKSGYTELGTSMHYWKDNQWMESKAQFRLFPGGAVAEEGPFNLIIAPDVSQEPVVDLLTPDSKRFQISPRWLAYHDRITGQSVMIAAVKPCVGQLVEPNVIAFADAFDDLHAALRFTYQPWGTEQEVLLLESGPLNPPDWGLNGDPANIVLEMWSEFHTWPEGGTAVASVESGLDDVKLVFGESQLGIGKAFSLGDEENSIAVGKTWTRVDQRQFLIEAVRQSDLAPLLAKLPQQAQANNPAQRVKGVAQRQVVAGRVGLLAQGTERLKAREKPTQTAAIQPAQDGSHPLLGAADEVSAKDKSISAGVRASQSSKPAVSIDYSIVTTISGFRFKGDTTYYVTNLVTLSGTTAIEGGTVIKFTYATNNNRLLISGSLDCQTSPYRPAIFTGKDDDTVGESISGSSGTPGTNRYAGRALELNAANTTYDLHDLRFRYTDNAIRVSSGSATSLLSHIQIGYANVALRNQYPHLIARNLLVHDALNLFNSNGTNRLEHATLHRIGTFRVSDAVYLTNCLLICVTNGMTYTGANNATNIDDTGIFQTIGAGSRYLASQSTNRNAGTTNINPTLLADLAKRTTYPPLVLTSPLTADLTLIAQSMRDTDAPDLGYHYDPLDYVVNQVSVTNAALSILAGTAIGVYGSSGSHGLRLEDGSQVRSYGSPVNLCRIVRYNLVQEQGNTNWSASTVGRSVVDASWGGSPRPIAQFRFTDWSAPAGGQEHIAGDYGSLPDTARFDFTHCQLRGGLITTLAANVTFTNCLFDRVGVLDLCAYSDYYNGLFFGGSFNVDGNYGTHNVADCFFDRTYFDTNTWIGTINHHNGYITNEVRLYPEGTNSVIVTDMVYQAGSLGLFYQPTNSFLLNTGSMSAATAGLWHFTTTTNQVAETNSVVDIGMHFVAVNSSSQPIDTDSDGLADYFEDLDGDGIVDSGEMDRNNSTDLGLRVVITRPKNGSNVP